MKAKVKKELCNLGFNCRATKLKHFIDFWHLPPRLNKKLLSLNN